MGSRDLVSTSFFANFNYTLTFLFSMHCLKMLKISTFYKYLFGKVDNSASGKMLTKIATALRVEMAEKFDAPVHILDWALYLDE